MHLEHSFSVPVGIDEAWKVLLDIERVAPCMPGAALDTVDGDEFTGTVKVKLGPINLTYKGHASFVEKDAIAWLLLQTVGSQDGRGGGDTLSGTTFIQRLNTSGGVAPSTGCKTSNDVGHQAFVPYTADYFFYTKAS